MHFWISRGKSVNQIVQKCLCQQKITLSSQNCNSLSLAKYYCINRTSLDKAPVTQFLPSLKNMSLVLKSNYSTSNENKIVESAPQLSTKDKLKRAVKDYGSTVMVFHISISLASLGISYLVISSGVDVGSLMEKLGFSSPNQLTTGASTFVVAYAVHKVFAPVRISITLGCTPFIVRYLRRVGILKPPKPSNP